MNAKKATIKQLMNHTAGMPDHDDEEGVDAYVVLLTDTPVEDEDPMFERWGRETLIGTGIKSITADFETSILAKD